MLYGALVYCASQMLCLNNSKVDGRPTCGKSIGAICQQHLVTLGLSGSRFGNSHNLSNFFIIVGQVNGSSLVKASKATD